MKKLIIVLLIVGAIIALASTNVRNARLVSNLTVYENLITPTTSTFIEQKGLNEVINYRDGLSRNDADNVYADTVMVNGPLDLTSLTNSLGESLDLTNERIVAIKFLSGANNSGTIVIDSVTTNGYDLMGAAFIFTLEPRQSLLFKADTMLGEVGASDKLIDYVCGNDTLSIILISADLN